MSNSTDMDSDGLSNATTILGVSLFDPEYPVATFFAYNALNVLICSLLPVPLASTMVGISVLLYGIVLGLVINTISGTLGSYLSLLVTRYACRPRLMRLLGRYQQKWEALDYAIVEDGYQIALLIRLVRGQVEAQDAAAALSAFVLGLGCRIPTPTPRRAWQAPVAPLVLCNILLSMTSISQR